jgi:hypothetical protein
MKKVASAACIITFCFVFLTNLSQAQQTFRTTSSGSIIGYLEYLPQDYNTNSNKYPVVIFLHGADERGAASTDPAVLQTTISNVSKLGPPAHVKAGAQFPFILISPQLKTSYGSWPSSYVNEVIEHCKTYLRIDEKRIHITGLSMGGHGTWTCVENMPQVFASVAPVCGASNTPSKACGIAAENVPVWAFHGDADPIVNYSKTVNMVKAINACTPAPSPAAKATIYAGVQHNAWYRAYFLDNTYHNPNYYQWAMGYTRTKRGGNTIPVANAGGDKSIALPTNSVSITGSGSDTGGSISAYKWTQLQGPSKAIISGNTAATMTASGLVTGTYIFKFTVTDNGGLIDSDFVKVAVTGTGSNIPPVVSAGNDKTLNLPTNSTTIAGAASDSDGISTYTWTKVSGGSATMTGNTTVTLSLSALAAGSYVFRLTATDSKGASSSDDVTVIVNNLPTVSAGADISITLPTSSVSIQGSVSDSDGSIATYAWTKISGSSATLSGTTSSKLTASGLVQGTYVFRLTATDNNGGSKYDEVTVTVSGSASNVLPVASAGDDRTITLPTSSLSITGSATDTDGTISSYGWTKISGGAATLSGASTATLSASGLVAGTYVFRLTVTDNKGGTDTDDVSVIVNSPPSVSAGSDYSITLPTNSTSIQGSASDTDGTIASYSWKMTTGSTGTLTGTTTSKLTATGLIEGPYVFRLTVTDNRGATKFDDVMITVKNSSTESTTPNDLPVADAGTDKLITLPTNSVTIAGVGSDSDGTISKYSWTKVSGGAATLSGATTNTLTASALVAGTYTFRLTVTDNKGGTDTDDISVIVNAPPVVSVGADLSITLPTNSLTVQGTVSDSDGTIKTYSWKMTTGTIATLSGTNTSKLTATGLVEGPYVFRLFVTDDRGATKFDDILITVKPKPNVAPVADAGTDQLITLPTNSVTITGKGTDADGTITGYSWSKVSGGAATLTATSTSTLNAAALVGGTYVFRLTVTDSKGGTDSDDVTVVVNKPPTVSVGADYSLILPANSTSIQGSVSDPDGAIVSYQWKMTTGTVATLSGATTSKLTAAGLIEGSYVFRLIVTDNRGAVKFDDVKIVVKTSTTSSTAFATEAITDNVGLEDDDAAKTLTYDDESYWIDKKVIIYDGSGKEMFSGRWSASDFTSVIETGKMYIFNILEKGKHVRQGKIFVTR